MFSKKILMISLAAVGLFGLATITLDIDVQVKGISAASSTQSAPGLDVYYPATLALKN